MMCCLSFRLALCVCVFIFSLIPCSSANLLSHDSLSGGLFSDQPPPLHLEEIQLTNILPRPQPAQVLIVFQLDNAETLNSNRVVSRFAALLNQTGADHRILLDSPPNSVSLVKLEHTYQHVLWLVVSQASNDDAAANICHEFEGSKPKASRPGPDGFCICGGKTWFEASVQDKTVRIPATKIAGFGGEPSALRESSPGSCPRGALYAAYELLGVVGFDLNKPFLPSSPTFHKASHVRALESALIEKNKIGVNGTKCSEPQWSIRSTHYHTMHPVELADVLNGFGANGTPDPLDERGFQSQLALYDSFLEWLIFTRQTGFEFALLYADGWKDFAYSETRRKRLSELVRRAHETCIGIGFDLPIVFVQQHGFALLRNIDQSEKDQASEIRANLDWAASTGIDFVGTESGLSEFTHPNCTDMLRWMNTAADYAAIKGLPIFIKAHCSTSQKCPEFEDLNFNFLPQLASSHLGVAPHTVQFYSLDGT